MDEETVQTTNPKGAAKAVVARITDWSLVRTQLAPPNAYENPAVIAGFFF